MNLKELLGIKQVTKMDVLKSINFTAEHICAGCNGAGKKYGLATRKSIENLQIEFEGALSLQEARDILSRVPDGDTCDICNGTGKDSSKVSLLDIIEYIKEIEAARL